MITYSGSGDADSSQLGNQNAEAIQCPVGDIASAPRISHGKSRLQYISVLFPLADTFNFEELVVTE